MYCGTEIRDSKWQIHSLEFCVCIEICIKYSSWIFQYCFFQLRGYLLKGKKNVTLKLTHTHTSETMPLEKSRSEIRASLQNMTLAVTLEKHHFRRSAN